MIFTSFEFVVFLALCFGLYWACPSRRLQNGLLLAASYLFYGWVHPWFCGLIALSTVVDYGCGRGMGRWPGRRRAFLALSLATNLGLLGIFKYFDFFAESFADVFAALGYRADPVLLGLILPVGISFYTFQTLSYTIDVYRGELAPRRSFLDFALFVAFFPQLTAGPIERARRLLPQIERARRFDARVFASAWPLIVRGAVKKLVVADNVAAFVDPIFLRNDPSPSLLFAGALAFAVQIYADFSAYTDLARGSARLFGFELMENFRAPYLAVSPSDFWRRWHISFSSWIRDYLYIPLGGSRVHGPARFLGVVLVTMGVSGLWHGAAGHYVLWGLYHGVLLFFYHQLGMGGAWRPRGALRTGAAWSAMLGFTLFGWLIFRAPSVSWLAAALSAPGSGSDLAAAVQIVAVVALFSLPIAAFHAVDRLPAESRWAPAAVHGLAVASIPVFLREAAQDFIYFQF